MNPGTGTSAPSVTSPGNPGITYPTIIGQPVTKALKQQAVVAFLESQIGKPYQLGPGRFGPNYYDCSGLVWAAYHSIGIDLTQLSQTQANEGKAIPTDPAYIQPGDLLLYPGANPPLDHIAIAISPVEEIEAPHTGANVTKAPIDFANLQRVRRILL